ncbi:MAG: DUF4399 domain-containing protein [Synechococcales cyanobacterium RM1_1_8]|nr:DUF4399 domain-containing protein [Synechococcales cyanobacterium RM1_1_8]
MPRASTALHPWLYPWFKATALLCCSLVLSLLGLGSAAPALAAAIQLSHAPETAQAYIISPADGDTVPPDFTVKFGLVGMGIAPAGVDKDNTGHHHLLIDLAELPPLTEPLPATEQIKHFGGGQTETQISLAPGEHSLQLVLGNYTHVPHDNPVVSEPLTITVK